MYTEDLTVIVVYAVVGYFLVVTFTALLRPIVFLFEPVFRAINRLQWIISNPIRFLWKYEGKMSRCSFITLTMTGITACWWIASYFITFPFRFVTGLYYDIILFSAISFSDNIDEFIKPKRGKLGYLKGGKYFFFYIITLPFRAVKMIMKSGLYILDSILMFGISLVFPTLTMLHGTKFREAGTKIVQGGEWRVGPGNYAGTGVYFGLDSKTAKYYAKQTALADNDISIVLVRVTLTFCKNTATLKDGDRRLIGLGETWRATCKTSERNISFYGTLAKRSRLVGILSFNAWKNELIYFLLERYVLLRLLVMEK